MVALPPSEEFRWAIVEEARGRYEIFTLLPNMSIALFQAAEAGDPHACKLLYSVTMTLRRIRSGIKPPAQCLTCSDDVTDEIGVGVVVVGANLDDATMLSASVVCPCCVAAPDLDERIQTTVRQDWARYKPSFHAPGRA